VKRICIAVLATMMGACGHSGSDGTPAPVAAGIPIPIVNGDFEQPMSGEDIPGWTFAHHGGVAGYKASLDHDDPAQGKTSLRFARVEPQVYGQMMMRLDLSKYAGKTIELSAMLKCADVGPKGWKLFINGNQPHTLAYSPGVKDTTGWQKQSVQLKLPAQGADDITIGVTLQDAGTGWADDVHLQVVD
jgi:hypothetical protein